MFSTKKRKENILARRRKRRNTLPQIAKKERPGPNWQRGQKNVADLPVGGGEGREGKRERKALFHVPGEKVRPYSTLPKRLQ